MAKKKKSVSKEIPLQGIIVRATGGVGLAPSIKLPNISSECFILLPKDILGSNRIDILKDSFPLLASSIISYIGQPLLLVLAPDLRSAEDISKKIKIDYITLKTAKPLKSPKIIEYQHGNLLEEIKKASTIEKADEVEEKKEEEEKTLDSYKSSINFKRRSTKEVYMTKIFVEKNDDIIDIYAPTQWPALIEDSVVTTCGYNKKKIIVHKEYNFSPKDEKLFYPAILASLATLGVLITGKKVEIHSSFPTFRTDTTIERTTWFDKSKHLIAEEIKVDVDQGAFPLFSEELSRQYLAGLIPLYQLNALKVTFNIISSYSPPSSFFGGLGYVDAIASSQIHSSKLGKHLGFTPFLWREYNLKESEIHNKIMRITNIGEQKQLLEELEGKSFFNRKYAAYKVKKSLKTKLSTFSPYARGIGLSIAPGISGFSSQFNDLARQPIKLTLDVGGKVECNTSFSHQGRSATIWKKIICDELDVEEKGISFTEDGPTIIDSGPCVLANNSGNMAKLFKKACDQITEKRFIQGLPIEVYAEIDRPNPKTNPPLFTSNTWVATVVELRINPITFRPVVFNVTLFCSIGVLANENTYRSKLQHSIISILRENGATLASGEEFNIEIILHQTNNELTDSINSGLKGAIIASFSTALDMALNSETTQLPTSSEAILDLIKDQL